MKMKMAGQADQIKQLVLRNGDAVNNHDLAAIADTLVPKLEAVGPDGTYRGRDGFLAELRTLLTGIAGLSNRHGRAHRRRLAYVARLEGTHLGPYQTANGRAVRKRVALQIVNVRYVGAGKIVKLVNSWDHPQPSG